MSTIEKIEEHFTEKRKSLLKMSQRKLGEFWAEDALMDAYEKAIRYAGRSGVVFNIDAYIKTILNNVIKDYQSDRVSSVEIEEGMWESGELAQEARSRGVLTEVLAELETYEEIPRTVLHLYLIQGEKADVVSRITGASLGSIKMLTMRFREVIKEKYEIK